jgi:hypothetical protein
LLLVLKLTLTPLFIGLVSLAGRRWGPAITGWLVGLPLTSGPVILFLAMERGEPFAAKAAKGAIMGLISVAAFCLVYGRVHAPGMITSNWRAKATRRTRYLCPVFFSPITSCRCGCAVLTLASFKNQTGANAAKGRTRKFFSACSPPPPWCWL